MIRASQRPRWLGVASLCLLLASPAVSRAQERVIVDADMGILNDDAVALFMLMNTPNVDVLGVTIVPGNTWMEQGTAYALRQLELVGRTDIPVFMGVREPLMGIRQPWLDAEERLWGRSEYLGAYARPRPRLL
jgi:inosine-uridine nucleoside N-ribohydrolase